MKKTGTTWKRRALAFALSAGMVMNSFHGLVSVPYYVYASDVVLDETGTDTDGFYEITGDQDSIAAQLAALVETETSDTGSSEDTESERLTEASGDMDELTVMNIEVADEVPVGLGGGDPEEIQEIDEMLSTCEEPQKDADGVYQISDAEDLCWLAESVNAGNAKVNAVLTQNITVNEALCQNDGTLRTAGITEDTIVWTPIGTEECPYSGIFDGRGYSIRGIYINDTSCENAGLFGTVLDGTIRNLTLMDSWIKGGETVGGIAGMMKCSAESGNVSIIESCISHAVVKAGKYTGGICGRLNAGTIKNSAYIPENADNSVESVLCGNVSADGTLQNCYFLSQTASEGAADQAAPKTEQQFVSGETAYLLGLRQNIGTDHFPTTDRTHSMVYSYTAVCTGETLYTNDALQSGSSVSHGCETGNCPLCGETVYIEETESEMENEVESETESESENESEAESEPDVFVEPESESETERCSEEETDCSEAAEEAETASDENEISVFSADEGISTQALSTTSPWVEAWFNFAYKDGDKVYEKWLKENFNWQCDVEKDGIYTDYEYWADQDTAYFVVCNADGSVDKSNIWKEGQHIEFWGPDGTNDLGIAVIWDFTPGYNPYGSGTSVFTINIRSSWVLQNLLEDWDGMCKQLFYSATKLKNDKTYNKYKDNIDSKFDENYVSFVINFAEGAVFDMEELTPEGEKIGIGTLEHPFVGTVNGNGATIKNLHMKTSSSQLGFINDIGRGQVLNKKDVGINTTIRDLTLENMEVTNTYGYDANDLYSTGLLVGKIRDPYVTTSANIRITNCHVKNSKVTGGKNVGALVGGVLYDVTVENCSSTNTSVVATNTINETGKYNAVNAGGLIGYTWGMTLKNCYNSGGSVQAGYDDAGGLIGTALGQVTVERCWNSARVTAESYVGGICAFTEKNTGSRFYMCYNVGELNGRFNHGITCSVNSDGTRAFEVSHCYSSAGCSYEGDEVTYCAEDEGFDYASEAASGELCWMLNDCTSGGTNWKQTIGTDAYPIFSGGSVVYSEVVCQNGGGEMREWNNTNEYTYYHDYNEDGFCKNDCCYDRNIAERFLPAQKNASGIYQITNGGNLFWWREQDTGNSDWKAVLTGDITVNRNVLNSSGKPTAESFKQDMALVTANSGKVFTGQLDGQGHSVSGIYVSGVNDIKYSGGLFGQTAGAVIRNIHLKDTYCNFSGTLGTKYYGGIAAEASNTTITGCTFDGYIILDNADTASFITGGIAGQVNNNALISQCWIKGSLTNNVAGGRTGGIAGQVYGATVKDCASELTLKAGVEISDAVGGIAGAVQTTDSVVSCINLGTVTGGTSYVYTDPLVPSTATKYYTNSYYMATESDEKGAKTAAQFASGEVTWLLNNGVTDGSQIWYQDVDNNSKPYDRHPVYKADGAAVFAYGSKFCGGGKTYTNQLPSDVSTEIHDAHEYSEAGFCIYCDAYEPPLKSGSSCYIENAGNLYWFASMVNGTLAKTCGDSATAQDLKATLSLRNDITVNDITLNADGTINGDTSAFRSWTPIADYGSDKSLVFGGWFNGNGHTISGLWLEDAQADNAALIGAAGSGCVIRELNLTDSYFKGKDYTAGICGELQQGVNIYDVCVDMTVNGQGQYAGGLAGQSEAAIQDCFAAGSIHAAQYAGGLAGKLGEKSSVSYSSSSASVSADGSAAGGLAGENAGQIRYSRSLGPVSGADQAGGLIGCQTGTSGYLANSYSYGTVSGSGKNIGAVIGKLSECRILNCYYAADGKLTGIGSAGEDTSGATTGKSKEAFGTGEVTYLLNKGAGITAWYQDVDNDQTPYDEYPVFSGEGAKVYCSAEDCESPLEYTNEKTGFDSVGHKFSEEGICSKCGAYEPAILLNDNRVDTVTDDTPYDAYYGAEGIGLNKSYVGYYAVTNAGQLYWTAAVVNGTLDEAKPSTYHSQDISLKIVLANDITDNQKLIVSDSGVSGTENARQWTPIGKFGYKGILDGNGKTIRGLYLCSDYNTIGLTGCLYTGSLVKNIALKNCYFEAQLREGMTSAYIYVGGITGKMTGGEISGCSTEVRITGAGASEAGGIAGSVFFADTLTRCSSSSTVEANDYAGGIIGWCFVDGYLDLQDCCNLGTVTCKNTNNCGALIGNVAVSDTASITSCYNYNPSLGSMLLGTAAADKADYTNCYYLSNETAEADTSERDPNITAKTAEEFESGEVAYLLNGGKVAENGTLEQEAVTDGTQAWYQNIDIGEKMAYPLFAGSTVYYGAVNCGDPDIKYTNYYANTAGHEFDNGFCKYCGEYEKAILLNAEQTDTITDETPYTAYYDAEGIGLSAAYNGYYAITNAGQLYWFAALVNGTLQEDDTNYEAQNTAAKGVLICDITDNAITVEADGTTEGVTSKTRRWIPIGDKDQSEKFCGILDGNMHSISGLYMDGTLETAGLIGEMSDNGCAKNLTLCNSCLEGTYRAGGIACTVEGDAIISNCQNEAVVLFGEKASDNMKDYCMGGGIAAWMTGGSNLENCSNRGNVIGYGYIGGLIGVMEGRTSDRVAQCSNLGSVSGYGHVGGLIGKWYDGNIDRCFNAGTVTRYSYTTSETDWASMNGIGGLIGTIDDYNQRGKLTNCYYAGTITNENHAGTAGYWIGTVVIRNNAIHTANVTVSNCHNVAYQESEVPCGACDEGATLTFQNCYYRTEDETNDDQVEGTTPKNAAAFADGSVAYLLNGGEIAEDGTLTQAAVTDGTQAWYQDIDNGAEPYDTYPIFEGGTVYYGPSSCGGTDFKYSNTSHGIQGHEYKNGFCIHCDVYEPAILLTDDEEDRAEDETPYTAYYELYDLNDPKYCDYYAITNAGQLYWFAALVNGEVQDIDSKYTQAEAHQGHTGMNANAILTSDITVNTLNVASDGSIDEAAEAAARSWTPIGSQKNGSAIRYRGTFDGNSKTIRGLYCRSDEDSAALVGVSYNASIQNVTLADSYFRGSSQTAGICAETRGTGSTITDCTSEAAVFAEAANAGGIVCTNRGTVENCTSKGVVKSTVSSDESDPAAQIYTGGIAAVSYGEIKNSTNTAAVSGIGITGGITGAASKIVLTNCTNEGVVEGSDQIGGITGTAIESELTECTNKGSVSGTDQIGGIAGTSSESTLSKCTNAGAVSGTDQIGGITGASAEDHLTNCTDTAAARITGQDQVGGIAGISGQTDMSSCQNAAAVSGRTAAGGIAGAAADLTLKYSFNSGAVTGALTGGLAGSLSTENLSENKIENCFNTGTVRYLSDADVSLCGIGGLIGYAANGKSAVRNAYHSGTVEAEGDAVSTFAGALIGAAADDGSSVSVTDSYSYEAEKTDLVGTNASESAVIFDNCYYRCDADSETVGRTGTTAKKTADFASGEVTWLLNSSKTDSSVTWRQNLDNGKAKQVRPLYDGGIVYRLIDCSTEEITGFSNTEVSSVHEYSKYGFCSKCGAYHPASVKTEDGQSYYEIENAGELFWIAAHINLADPTEDPRIFENTASKGIGTNIQIVLKNDIDLSTGVPDGLTWVPLGRFSDHADYKSKNRQFTGIFDGNFHTITGMTVDEEDPYECGFFGRAYSATIKNLGVFGKVTSSYTGKLSANAENSGVRAGILAGELYKCTVIGCYTGSEAAEGENAVNTLHPQAGGFAGEAHTSTISSCYTQCTVFLGTGGTSPSAVTDCYFVSEEGGTEAGGRIIGKSQTAFESGEVTWLLNGSVADCDIPVMDAKELTWKQADKAVYPSFKGNTIYISYWDCAMSEASKCFLPYQYQTPEHRFDQNGFCSNKRHNSDEVCGAYEPAADSDEDGYYEIDNAGELYWFAAHVNHDLSAVTDFSEIAGITKKTVNQSVDYTTNAKLTFDTYESLGDLPGDPQWEPIGAPGRDYQGIFDGDNKHLLDFSYTGGTNSGQPAGLFGYVKNGTIKNLKITGTMKINAESANARGSIGVIGCTVGATTIQNIISDITFDFSKITDTVRNVGGIVGKAEGTLKISGCTYQGGVIGSADGLLEQVGGIVGAASAKSNVTVTDCTVKKGTNLLSASDARMIGGILGSAEDHSVLTIQKCANYGTVNTALPNERDCFGGIVAYVKPSVAYTIENCAFYGTIQNDASAFGKLTKIGGILGYHRDDTDNNTNVIRNCLAVGTISSAAPDAATTGAIGGILNVSGGSIVLENNYYRQGMLADLADQVIGTGTGAVGTPITINGTTDAVRHSEDTLESGETTWLLNGKRPVDLTDSDTEEDPDEEATLAALVWHQTLRKNDLSGDPYPYFTGGVVYKENGAFQNNRGTVFEHTFDENGFCTETHEGESDRCYAYEQAWQITDDEADTLALASARHKVHYAEVGLDVSYVGYYTPRNTGQLYWLAAHVSYANPVTQMDDRYHCVRNETRSFKVGRNVNIVLTLDMNTTSRPSARNNAVAWHPIGRFGKTWNSETADDRSYCGIFDGNNHTITMGWESRDTGTGYDFLEYGVFGRAAGAVIRNLGVTSASASDKIYIDSADENEGELYYGGMAGILQNCTVSNCYAQIQYSVDTNISCKTGYFAGAAPGSTITNCYAMKYEETDSTNFLGADTEAPAQLKNCYYVLGTDTGATATDAFGAIGLSYYAFTGGEVTWRLSGSSLDWNSSDEDTEAVIWQQDLSAESYPALGNTKPVYAGYKNCACIDRIYSNSKTTEPPAHSFNSQDQCSTCNVCKPAILVTDDPDDTETDDTPYTAYYEALNLDSSYVGYYAIKTYAQLHWFADHINYDDPVAEKRAPVCANTFDETVTLSSNAVVRGDINVNDGIYYKFNGERIWWKPIGCSADRAYKGIFDGQGHRIELHVNNDHSSAYVAEYEETEGIFGYVSNARIKNIYNNYQPDMTIKGKAVTAAGGIIAWASGYTVVENVHATISIKVDASVQEPVRYIGGIVGYAEGTITLKNCSYAKEGYHDTGATISVSDNGQTSSYIGGILGCAAGSAKFINCSYSGNFTGYMSPASNTSINVSGGEKIGGILGGATGTSVEMQQCASFAPVSSGARYIGGIMGYASEKTLVTIKDCGNYSILNCDAAEKVGGILGGSDGGRISISHSLALGAVSSSAESVGAIAGSLVKVNDNISLSNCYYYYDSDTSCSSPAAVGTGASDGQTAYVPNDTAEARMRQSSEDITSMKTAYLLNDKPFSTDTDKVWYQNTGIVTWNNKAAPYFEGDPVTYKPVINYDIQYGGAEFVYERGQWNPETHQYAGGQWKQENAADTQVSVKNNMETPIEASITVIQAHEIPDLNLPDDGITVSLENYISSSGEAVSEDGMCTLNQNEVLQAMVAVSGIPNENFDSTGTKQQLAAITVAVSILNEMSD